MALGVATAVRNTKMGKMADAVDAGAGAGLLRLYDGTRPITGGSVTNLLVELTFSTTSFGSPSSGAIAANAIAAVLSSLSGTATWFRIVDSANTFVCDGEVGTDLVLNNAVIASGVLVEITSVVLTDGDS